MDNANKPRQRPTSRGRATRDKLIATARAIFERDGFFDARIEDIVSESGVSRGTFYTYFDTKLAVLNEIVDSITLKYSDGSRLPLDILLSDPNRCIMQFISRYFEVYEENARMQEIITQVGTVDVQVRERRLADRRKHVDNIAFAIQLWQENGLADETIDPKLTAAALASMLTNFAFWWMIGGDFQDRQSVYDNLAQIWSRAIGLSFDKASASDGEGAAAAYDGPLVGITDKPSDLDAVPISRRGYWR
ncbi:TetR/AcrR family transcriptional regulator [Marinovum sp.]|uniref:TetR/AcrR family transcriptional regulator n=1 Tax=Marinovum sp. TaxID=2024839 RepID=UPI003A9418AF